MASPGKPESSARRLDFQSDRPKRDVPLILQLGCAHVFCMLLAAGCLLAVNTLAVSSAYHVWLEANGPRHTDPRVAQTVLILCPLLLLFLQYQLYDRLRDWWRPAEKQATRI